MSDLVNTLAERAGVSPETARRGLGALLNLVKEHLGSDAYGKARAALPDADAMVAEFESSRESSKGGFLGAISDLAGKLLGGEAKGGADLLSSFSHAGLDAGQIKAFLPKALELLRGHLPPEVLERLASLVPGEADAAGVEGPAEAADAQPAG
jgi:hypothetical protein